MSGICRVGIDTAGGVILGGGQNFVYANGALVSVEFLCCHALLLEFLKILIVEH